MQRLRCHSCSKELKTGSLKYIIEVKSFADFDGYLEDFEGDLEEGLSLLFESIENSDGKDLEDEVSKESIFILCKPCRDRFMSDPFHTGKASFEEDEVKGTVH